MRKPSCSADSEPSALAMPSMVMISEFGLHREYGAGFHRHAVEIDGAGAAMGGLAADMGAGHREVFADEMHQQRARFDEAFDLGAVHLHGDMGFCHLFLP